MTQCLYERHPEVFRRILARMSQRVPGVQEVTAEATVDGRVVLHFQDGALRDPFIAKYVSDGMIKMFAYLVLLHGPAPHPLLRVEEPENQLYATLLRELVEEFRDDARQGGKVLTSTHSPDLLSAATLDEVYWIEKRAGFSTIVRAADSEQLRALVAEGDTIGKPWRQGLLGAVNPCSSRSCSKTRRWPSSIARSSRAFFEPRAVPAHHARGEKQP